MLLLIKVTPSNLTVTLIEEEIYCKFFLLAHGTCFIFFSWSNCLFASRTLIFCCWLWANLRHPVLTSSVWLEKNLHGTELAVETCRCNVGFELFWAASLKPQSVSGCFHSRCKGILEDRNKNLYVKGGIWWSSEGKFNRAESLPICCWECIFNWKGCCKSCIQVYNLKDRKYNNAMYFSSFFFCSTLKAWVELWLGEGFCLRLAGKLWLACQSW